MENNNYMTKDLYTEELLRILNEHYSPIYRRDIKMNANILISNGDNLKLQIYFYNYTPYGKTQIVYLSELDIQTCLSKYANTLGYSLDNYKYMGGIRKVGYFIEKDTPYFEGVRLFFKEKNKTKIKK